MGADAYNGCKHLWRHAVCLISIGYFLKPGARFRIAERVTPEGIQQHGNVGKNHPRSSNTSSKAAELSRLTPWRVPPRAMDTGMRIIALRGRRAIRASTRRSPRSIRAVRVSPLRVASAFALVISAGSNRTVVRIMSKLYL